MVYLRQSVSIYSPLGEVRHYLDTVERKFCYLETADLDQQERLWRWLIQRESQHSEIITFVLQLLTLEGFRRKKA